MKLAFKIVREIISIPLEAILCLLTLGCLPFLLPFVIVGLISSGFFPSFVASFYLSRNLAALKRRIASALVWFVAFSVLLFFDQFAAKVIFRVHLNFWLANCGAALGAVLFRRYIAERLICKIRKTTQGEIIVAAPSAPPDSPSAFHR